MLRTPVPCEPIHRRLDLLVRHRSCVEDVLGALLPLVVNWEPKHVVVALEDRRHPLATRRGPATWKLALSVRRGALQKINLMVRVNDKRGRHWRCPELLASAAEHRPGEELTVRSCEVLRGHRGVVV